MFYTLYIYSTHSVIHITVQKSEMTFALMAQYNILDFSDFSNNSKNKKMFQRNVCMSVKKAT